MSGKVPDEFSLEPSDNTTFVSASQLPAVHIVQLVYTSPSDFYADAICTNVAVFTSEDRARLFIEWAGGELERIRKAMLELKAQRTKDGRKPLIDEEAIVEALNVPMIIAQDIPTCHYTTEAHHFEYAEEFDLDPMFG